MADQLTAPCGRLVTTGAANDAHVTGAASDGSLAIANLARDHHSALLRLLTARTRSREDAKEILQEAYTKLLVLDRIETITALVAYLWRIAMNLVIDRGRRRTLNQRFCRSLPDDRRHEVSSDVVVESKERLATVERAISELPPRCHQAFVLHVLKGLTFGEVGREMEISDRMAKKHVARALEYLHFCLDAAEATGPAPPVDGDSKNA